jgi:hypothetical protein
VYGVGRVYLEAALSLLKDHEQTVLIELAFTLRRDCETPREGGGCGFTYGDFGVPQAGPKVVEYVVHLVVHQVGNSKCQLSKDEYGGISPRLNALACETKR